MYFKLTINDDSYHVQNTAVSFLIEVQEQIRPSSCGTGILAR